MIAYIIPMHVCFLSNSYQIIYITNEHQYIHTIHTTITQKSKKHAIKSCALVKEEVNKGHALLDDFVNKHADHHRNQLRAVCIGLFSLSLCLSLCDCVVGYSS